MANKTTRREFLKQVALTGAAISGLPMVTTAAETTPKNTDGKSRVVIATNSAVLNGEDQINQNVLQKMLDSSVAKLTNAPSGVAGWKSLFSPSDIVGLKVNCLFGKGVSTHPEVVKAIIQGLKSAGVNEDNIIIWDRSSGDLIKCGFTPNKDGKGVKCYADDGDWGEMIENGSFKGRITKIISEKVTAFINVPILKTHGTTGISCCLKNHYGSFDNPGKHHGNNCNPAMADFSAIPVVKNKTRLVVVDALRPQFEGGPGSKLNSQRNYFSLLTSKDPVAADFQGLQIIQSMRNSAKLEPIEPKRTAWLESAQERGVGVCDPAKIELLKV